MFQIKVVEKIKTQILCSRTLPPPPQNCAIYEMWKNIVEPDRPHMIIRRMRISLWIPKATNTHSQYVILTAFPLQQWLQERDSILRYTRLHFSCKVSISNACVKGWLVSIASPFFYPNPPHETSKVKPFRVINNFTHFLILDHAFS
jgi:hypothetical protein